MAVPVLTWTALKTARTQAQERPEPHMARICSRTTCRVLRGTGGKVSVGQKS